jgi:hypothetical protein
MTKKLFFTIKIIIINLQISSSDYDLDFKCDIIILSFGNFISGYLFVCFVCDHTLTFPKHGAFQYTYGIIGKSSSRWCVQCSFHKF